MAIGALTTGAQTVTATGAVTPTTGLDISGITGDCTVHLRVQGLSAASGTPKARITLEDSVNAFTAVITSAEVDVQGTVVTQAEQHYVWKKYQLPSTRFGTTSAVLRVNVLGLGGTTPSLTLDAWVEY
jgi:hypothetical protein